VAGSRFAPGHPGLFFFVIILIKKNIILPLTMDKNNYDYDNHDLQDLQDQFYIQIVRRRDIPRRMNWRQRANTLSQR